MTKTEVGARGAEITVPDPPRIPGFRFRHFRGREDHVGMVRANMAARRVEGILEVVTVEGQAAMYANLSNCDPFEDVIIAEVDGQIVAYGRVSWADNSDGTREYKSICLVDPAVRRRGIGRAMLRWLEERAREVAAGQATDRPRCHASFLWDRDEGGLVLLPAEGYEAVRRGAEMLRSSMDDIPDAPTPDGLVLRPGSADQARAVFDASVEIFRDHWGAVDDTPAGYRQFVDSPAFDPSLWVVAWDRDAIAGIVIASIQDGPTAGEKLGYLDSVGVRRAWRRRGVGRAIVVASLRALHERGATSAGLGVDLQNQNEAARLYESVGFTILTTSTEFRKPLD